MSDSIISSFLIHAKVFNPGVQKTQAEKQLLPRAGQLTRDCAKGRIEYKKACVITTGLFHNHL